VAAAIVALVVMGAGVITLGELLERCLRVWRIDAVYGRPLPGVRVVAVDDPMVAARLAAAHWRVHRAGAAVHAGDGRLLLGPTPPAGTEIVVTDPGGLLDSVATSAAPPGALRLDLDLAAPAPDVLPAAPSPGDGWLEPDPGLVEKLTCARSPVVLAGPGVVANDAVAELNAFVAAWDLGVLNTWGAKGVLHWRSRHHWATVGLQARDFELGGLATADLIVGAGVDADEAPADRWQLAPVVEAPTHCLAPLAEHRSRPGRGLDVPPLRSALASVTQDGWTSDAAPLAPSRATRHYGLCFARGGLVAADPGVAGYWVARTLPTTEVGAAQVPAHADEGGFAVACALVARLRRPRRPVLAAVDGPVTASVERVLDAARRLEVSIPLEVWDPAGPPLDPASHLERLERLAVAHDPAPVSVATHPAQLDRMLDVAGPIVAWGDLPAREQGAVDRERGR
jgi:hypothetical protein